MLIWKISNRVMTDEYALTALGCISFIALTVVYCTQSSDTSDSRAGLIVCLSRTGLSRRHELIHDELIQEEGKRPNCLWEILDHQNGRVMEEEEL